jgi:uncharacterized integral membrane protein
MTKKKCRDEEWVVLKVGLLLNLLYTIFVRSYSSPIVPFVWRKENCAKFLLKSYDQRC